MFTVPPHSLFDGKICTCCRKWCEFSLFSKSSSNKDGFQFRCKVCQKAYAEANKDRIKEVNEIWRLANLDKFRATQKRCYEKNAEKWRARKHAYDAKPEVLARKRYQRSLIKEKRKAQTKLYYWKYKDVINERQRKWRAENIESDKASKKRWLANNPEKAKHIAKESTHRRREIKKASGKFTLEMWKSLCDSYNNKCLCCGATGVKLTVDHIVPLSRGGSHEVSNIQPLCKPCNNHKFTRTTDYRPK